MNFRSSFCHWEIHNNDKKEKYITNDFRLIQTLLVTDLLLETNYLINIDCVLHLYDKRKFFDHILL